MTFARGLVSAVTLEDPATSPGYFYEQEAGKKLIAVEFIVGNTSAETSVQMFFMQY